MASEVERYVPALEGSIVIVTSCGEQQDSCRCVLEPHGGGPHECVCGGSWEYVNGEMVVHSLPRGGWAANLAMIFGSQVVAGPCYFNRRPTSVGQYVQIGFSGPRECHTTAGGIRVHVQPDCRCPRKRR
jgi:hypothetical protein